MKIRQKIKSNVKNLLHTKKFKYSTLSATFTAIFISIVFLINIVCSTLVQKYNIQIDLSSNQLYQISDQTKSFLKNYNKKTKLILLDDEQTFKNGSPYLLHIYNISKNIASENPNIDIEFVNLDQNPNFVSNYPNFKLNSGGILITDDSNNSQYLPQSKMFTPSYGDIHNQQHQIVSNVESNIAHALEFISGQNPVKTAVINGHGETDISPIVQQFKDNGYDLNNLNFAKDEISENIELIIICSPKTDYTSEDISKIEEYLNNGGSLIYFASATQTKLPNLESLLQKYGITFSEGMVVETNPKNLIGNSTNQFYSLADDSNKYTENISIKNAPIVVKSCKPMHLEKINDAIIQTEICATSKTCSILNENDKNFKYESAPKSSFSVAIGTQKNINDKKTTKVTAFSNIEILSAMDIPNYGNGEFVLSVLGETTDHKSNITILPKSMSTPPLGINILQVTIIGFLFMAVVPTTIAIIGYIVYRYRKRR